MRRSLNVIARAVVMLAVLIAGTDVLSAHEDFRVIGTVTRHQASAIGVKKKDGKVASIRLDKQTMISRDGKKVDAAEIKVGTSVVVDAYGDSEEDLLALEIRIVPAIAAQK
jgi:hypothetical protein